MGAELKVITVQAIEQLDPEVARRHQEMYRKLDEAQQRAYDELKLYEQELFIHGRVEADKRSAVRFVQRKWQV